MYKTVANAMYTMAMNYRHSILHSSTVAAAITLFSRKTFSEATYLYEYRAAEATGIAFSIVDSNLSVMDSLSRYRRGHSSSIDREKGDDSFEFRQRWTGEIDIRMFVANQRDDSYE